MKTRLTKLGRELALVLDQSLLDQLDCEVSSDTEFEVVSDGQRLLIVPIGSDESDERFERAMENINERYDDMFRNLAKK